MTLGKRIAQLRQEKELTQEGLAELLGISRPGLGLYETDKREPDYETLGKIAKYFNVSTDYLLGHTEIRKYTEINVTPKEFFPPDIAEEIEHYANYIRIFKEKKYSPEEVSEIAEFIRKYSK